MSPGRAWSESPTTRRPLFVGGTGRSGTTIVASLLGAHPEYHMISIEVRFIVDRDGICDLVADRCGLDRFCRKMTGWWWDRRLPNGARRGLHLVAEKASVERALDRLRTDARHDPIRAGSRFVFDLLDPLAARAGANGWVEMTPPNVARGVELRRLFPEMRLIHVVRDGREVAASVARMSWGPNDPFEALQWWADRMLDAHQGCTGLAGDEFLTIRMEDIVQSVVNGDGALQRLFEFAELNVTPEVEQFCAANVDARKARSRRWTKVVPQDLHARFEDRYRAHLESLLNAGVAIPCVAT